MSCVQNLLGTLGWKLFCHIFKNAKKLERMVNQAKLRSYRREPCWKFGGMVPRTHNHTVKIDQANGNCLWQESEATEKQLTDYKTFIDKVKDGILPDGYKKILCHMVYDVKHDERHKVRLVAGGHLTDPNTQSVYSRVVSLQVIRFVRFLSELNKLELWELTSVMLTLRPPTKNECTLLVVLSSGLCWHQRFANVLCSLGFNQCKSEGDIWMR
jgi:hypothetical protein